MQMSLTDADAGGVCVCVHARTMMATTLRRAHPGSLVKLCEKKARDKGLGGTMPVQMGKSPSPGLGPAASKTPSSGPTGGGRGRWPQGRMAIRVGTLLTGLLCRGRSERRRLLLSCWSTEVESWGSYLENVI